MKNEYHEQMNQYYGTIKSTRRTNNLMLGTNYYT